MRSGAPPREGAPLSSETRRRWADNVMLLWIDLWLPFTEAHTSPVDEELIGQIYDYASWCWTESRNYHTQTAVACAFYEHLPRERKVRERMAKWIPVDLFEGLKEVFRYPLREQLDEFVRAFYEQRERFAAAAAPRPPPPMRGRLALLRPPASGVGLECRKSRFRPREP
jgi:hypothetical protein